MANLEGRVDELWASLSRQVMASKDPSAGLGLVQRQMLVQLIDEYLGQQQEPTVAAGRHAFADPTNTVTVGDAISILDVMKGRW